MIHLKYLVTRGFGNEIYKTELLSFWLGELLTQYFKVFGCAMTLDGNLGRFHF